MREDRIEAALDACYEAVVSPSSWADALQNLASTFDAAALMFYPFLAKPGSVDPRDPDRSLAKAPISHGYQELIEEYERDSWYLNHYRAERGLPLLMAGRPVVIEHQLATDEERRTSRHYNELYLRYGFSGYAMLNVPLLDQAWCVPMVRTPGQGHFTPGDAQQMQRLIPHFRRLINLSNKLDTERGRGVTAGLAAVNAPAVLIDWRGIVCSINPAAEALLGPDLKMRHGTLVASDRHSDRELDALIRNALGVGRASVAGMRPSSLVARRQARPILVEALPLSGLFNETFGNARVLLLLTDLALRPIPREQRLQSIFGLTAAEARLAARLTAGDSLHDISDELGVSYETTRSQLRMVFDKTGTHRQVELLALLARLAN